MKCWARRNIQKFSLPLYPTVHDNSFLMHQKHSLFWEISNLESLIWHYNNLLIMTDDNDDKQDLAKQEKDMAWIILVPYSY